MKKAPAERKDRGAHVFFEPAARARGYLFLAAKK